MGQLSIMGVSILPGFYKTIIYLNHNEPYLTKDTVVKTIRARAIYPFLWGWGINIMNVDPHAVHLVRESPATMNPLSC
jgi:hypothetical protein